MTREQMIDQAVRTKPLFVADIAYWDRGGSARGHMANCPSCKAIVSEVRAEFRMIRMGAELREEAIGLANWIKSGGHLGDC